MMGGVNLLKMFQVFVLFFMRGGVDLLRNNKPSAKKNSPLNFLFFLPHFLLQRADIIFNYMMFTTLL
jgi:hypothetical protein